MKGSDECTPPGKPELLNLVHAEISNSKRVTVLKSQDTQTPHGMAENTLLGLRGLPRQQI